MSTPLGRVTETLPEKRGPDVTHSVCVPLEWIAAGALVRLKLPRLLSCALCEGGGCDRCARAGALEMRTREEPVEVLSVQLTPLPEGNAQLLRIPNAGAFAEHPEEPRGCLMLKVLPGPVSSGVERVATECEQTEAPVRLSPWLLAAVALVIAGLILALLLSH
jgi:hypothetical protein